MDDVPSWNYDGSSTYQATTSNSEVILKPVAVYRDPHFEKEMPFSLCAKLINTLTRDLRNSTRVKQTFAQFLQKLWKTPKKRNRGSESSRSTPSSNIPEETASGLSDCQKENYRACLHAGVQISGTNGGIFLLRKSTCTLRFLAVLAIRRFTARIGKLLWREMPVPVP